MAERSIALRIAIRDAEQAARILKSLGADGEAAFRRIAEGAPRATTALNSVGETSNRAGRQLGQQFQNAGFQVQDFFVQVQSGTPILTAVIQQGSQLASAFGGVGVAFGLVGTVIGVVAGALYNMSGNSAEAAEEADKLAAANKSVAEALRITGNDADALALKFDRLNESQRAFAIFGLEEEVRKKSEALKDLREKAVEDTSGLDFARLQIGAAADPRLQGPEAEAARRLAEVNKQIVAARDAVAGGGSITDFVNTLNRLGESDESLKKVAQGLLKTGQAGLVAEAAIAELDARLAAYKKTATEGQKGIVSGKDPIDEGLEGAKKTAAKLASLREDVAASRLGERDLAGANAAQALGAKATQAEREEAERLGKALYDLREAREAEGQARTKSATEAKRAASEKERQSEAVREFVVNVERERAAALRLQAAQAKGEDAYEAEKRAIEAENAVRSRKLGITDKETDSLIAIITATKGITAATDDRRKAEEKAERGRQQDEDAVFRDADRDIKKENEELAREAERQADILADIFAQPFKDIASEVNNLTADMIQSLAGVGEDGGKSFAMKFQEATQDLTTKLLASIVSAPVNIAIGGLQEALATAAKSGGPGGTAGGFGAQLGAVNQWATANPLNAGMAGAAGGAAIGTVYGAATGKSNTYAAAGGAVGGAAGAAIGTYIAPGIGTYVGGALGSVAGSFIGGMFGGGDDQSGDNNMRQRFRPGQGVYYRESVQEGGEQNAQQVNQFMAQLMKAGKVFEQAGLVVNENFGPGVDLKVGSNTGITLNGKTYSSIEDALGAALQQLGTRGYRSEGESIQEQIARNTKATTVEGLAADFQFGKEYPRLIKGGGDLGRALDEITERFEALKDKAAELGLSVSKLDAVQDEQIHRMREEARLRIDILTGDASEYRQALESLSATFETAKQDAKDLGLSTERLNAARDRERERLEEEANLRVDMLSGKGGDYLQAQIALNAKYEEAKRIAIDLGRTTDDLNKARDRERDQLEDEAKQSIRRLTGDFGSLDEALLTLNRTFEDAKQLANQLGISTEKLNAARDAERERLRASANADIRVMMGEWDPLAQQLLQLRDTFQAANENARDLGYTEERLIEARKRATAELIENRRREVEDAVASQAEQIRGFFAGILDPLKQARSAFGGLMGIAAPSASIDAGLADFRDVAARARGDDLSAIQQLPQLGQQLIQYARQYGASGADATGIIREVQKAYAEIENRYRDRQLEVMQSIPEAVIRTGADQIKVMQAGLDRVVEQLRVVEKTIRANKSGLLTAA